MNVTNRPKFGAVRDMLVVVVLSALIVLGAVHLIVDIVRLVCGT